MREIKFRKWILKEMDYSPDIWADGEGGVLVNYFFGNDDDGIWMQYTGLKDKKGVEIYEGDILKQDYERDYDVRYDPDSLGYVSHETDFGWHKGVVSITASNGACLRNPIHHSDSYGVTEVTRMYKRIAGYRSEVIGNIYENPELLEGKQ